MSMRAGNLLWNRMKVLIVADAAPNPANLVDTGIWQSNRSLRANGANEPGMPRVGLVGSASRVTVIPMMPTANWVDISHLEPYSTVNLDGRSTVKVQFENGGQVDKMIDVLFWDPHTLCGPGVAADPISKVLPDNTKDGTLLWSRQQITLAAGAGAGNLIDTLVTQTDRSFESDSVAEPGMASRLQVIPLAYDQTLSGWDGVTHSDPVVTTNPDGRATVKVQFQNANEGPTVIWVLFWNPHTAIGPGMADLYNPIG